MLALLFKSNVPQLEPVIDSFPDWSAFRPPLDPGQLFPLLTSKPICDYTGPERNKKYTYREGRQRDINGQSAA